MKIYIKNMVCSRCKMVVETILNEHQIIPVLTNLGEVEIEEDLTEEKLFALNSSLKKMGFELIDDKKSRIVNKIKTIIISQVFHSNEANSVNLSKHISDQLNYDYNHLSTIFSELEGISIEKYFINQRIERVKELILYDELSLSEIAYQLGYSSVSHLSNQFKKITGLTPSFYKSLKEHKRTNIEEL
ncbi:MAG: AraC family transcriptional regulator [Bacteroidetes bacterium]|nr:AraC family transcriptional regulator [Bacteroidota bacterium]MBU1372714.1 AraC family transcriptional regulator [Bacteroidota bacterium]MBU1484910.1 AraC family transcriptional regulator [Bacteroidota bacterium]MBU1761245.1 AraC family transcriptional regulator [Bacteroidota bacterium]MBU2046565.1 AraC family transcriptional regulator [Bacteroidota bacterium]